MGKQKRWSYPGDEGRSVVRRVINLDLPARIGVVADSHSKIDPRAMPMLKQNKPAFILHAGDIGDLSVLDELNTIAPVIAVRGNIDLGGTATPDDVIIDVLWRGSRVSRWLLTHIALRGPRVVRPVVEYSQREGISLVLCGHSHVPLLSSQGGITVFNPGSLGPRRFQLPILFGLISLSPTSIQCTHLSCETGTRWLPPRMP